MAPPEASGDAPVAKRSIRELTLRSVKRTHEMFEGALASRPPTHEASVKLKMAVKIRDEYQAVRDATRVEPAPSRATTTAAAPAPPPSSSSAAAAADAVIPGEALAAQARRGGKPSDVADLIDAIDDDDDDDLASVAGRPTAGGTRALSLSLAPPKDRSAVGASSQVAPAFRKPRSETFSASLIPRLASEWPRPEWRAPWKLYRVISGHQGWVRSVAVDPSNEWFATGSADRTIKIWDLASGALKLTLTGHIEQVTGLAVSDRHPYMFSCGLDKMVKCWDLEYNKVIRHYHGHLSGVYSLALHPALDVLMTGGRDSACRVWDMRTKLQAMCLTGHDATVGAVASQREDPQVITGSYDSTVKLWDLAKGKCHATLTHHKKGVRALALHPKEFTFMSASADNIKKFGFPNGTFLHNALEQQRTIVNALAVNEDGVVASGGDDGKLWFWDYKSGHCFQKHAAKVQPGSMESEAGIFAAAFDRTGTRLITVEADKTIKMWKQDEDASEETHPNEPFVPPTNLKRF